MRYTLFLLTGLCFSANSHAQNTNSTAQGNSFKVALIKDSMSVIYNNQQVPVTTLQGLDSLIKKLPDLKHLKIEFETKNADPERSRPISKVLDQCGCEIIKKSINFRD